MAASSTVTTSGLGTYTVPANVYSVKVAAWGGGGGGGVRSGVGGGGGGGGGYAMGTFTVVPAGTYGYTVGTGGASDSGVGGSTAFNTAAGAAQLVAFGGTSSTDDNGGSPGMAGTWGPVHFAGGVGGTANTTGDVSGGEVVLEDQMEQVKLELML